MPRPPDRRLLAGLLALAASAGCALLPAIAALNLYSGAEFPGSVRTSDHTLFRPGWASTIRRDASYESSAPFGEVYIWYSRTYGLGPAQYGQGACIVMARSRTFARAIDYDVGIMVCD